MTILLLADESIHPVFFKRNNFGFVSIFYAGCLEPTQMKSWTALLIGSSFSGCSVNRCSPRSELRLTRVCLERPCISQCLEKGGIAKYWSISKRINYSHCVGSYGAQAYRLDYTTACASGPERLRDRKVCLQMWKVNVLHTSRSEWNSQGEHYWKVKIGFFPSCRNGECWPEEQKYFFFFFPFTMFQSVTTRNRPSTWKLVN